MTSQTCSTCGSHRILLVRARNAAVNMVKKNIGACCGFIITTRTDGVGRGDKTCLLPRPVGVDKTQNRELVEKTYVVLSDTGRMMYDWMSYFF